MSTGCPCFSGSFSRSVQGTAVRVDCATRLPRALAVEESVLRGFQDPPDCLREERQKRGVAFLEQIGLDCSV